MRCIQEVLRLKLDLSRSQREIVASTGLSKGSVSKYLRLAKRAGLGSWADARDLSEADLEALLFPPVTHVPASQRAPIDLEWVHREMRKKGVTLQLLWTEYCDGARKSDKGRKHYRYSLFCLKYREFRKRLDLVMRQHHRAGEKCFVDYSGARAKIVDRKTGNVTEVELYVATLGASSYTFAEATLTQRRDDFIASTRRAFEYFGGVPLVTVPDQLRSAVSGPDRLDPDINPVFAEFAGHYKTAVIVNERAQWVEKASFRPGYLIVGHWIQARFPASSVV